MKKQYVFLAIAFGAMLAITGCGDEGDGGSGGTAGSGASAGSGGSGGGAAGSGGTASGDFCDVLCNSCGGGQAECLQQCNGGIGQVPGQLDSCPTELDALGQCLGANDCTNSEACEAEWTAWLTCIITGGIGF